MFNLIMEACEMNVKTNAEKEWLPSAAQWRILGMKREKQMKALRRTTQRKQHKL